MADLTVPGDGIEGKGLRGSSRKPLLARGAYKSNGVVCYKFSAAFDVRAGINASPPRGNPRLLPTASVSPSDRVICESAVILSIRPQYSNEVRPGSHKHKANCWFFASQAGATVQSSHQEIADALAKRRPLS